MGLLDKIPFPYAMSTFIKNLFDTTSGHRHDGSDSRAVYLGSGVVGETQLASLAVTAGKIGAGAVDTTKLATTASVNCKAIADPGTGEAIPVTGSGYVPLTIVVDADETNTLADPTFIGQELTIFPAIHGGGTGNRVITCATRINNDGDTAITLDKQTSCIVLRAVQYGADFEWRAIGNVDCTLA
jgi:hypothetical protein